MDDPFNYELSSLNNAPLFSHIEAIPCLIASSTLSPAPHLMLKSPVPPPILPKSTFVSFPS